MITFPSSENDCDLGVMDCGAFFFCGDENDENDQMNAPVDTDWDYDHLMDESYQTALTRQSSDQKLERMESVWVRMQKEKHGSKPADQKPSTKDESKPSGRQKPSTKERKPFRLL